MSEKEKKEVTVDGFKMAALECTLCGYQEEQKYKGRPKKNFGICPTCHTGYLKYTGDVEER